VQFEERPVAAPSISQLPNCPISQLFNLFVRRVLAATVAELFELQPLRCRFPVLGGRIIALFAITAL
jgi:hypothetical protein